MNAKGQIDAARYPNFADLARHSTWFRNATGEHEGTHAAVPAILDSRLPKRGRQPTFADHPQNLFTLLGGRYRMNVWETQTHLCPTSLCRGKGELSTSFVARMHSLFEDAGIVYLHMVLPSSEERRIPDVGTAWGHYRRVADRGASFEKGRFDKFMASIRRPGRRPTLDLAHILLPHGTWDLLPSCHQDITPNYSPGLMVPGTVWGSNRWLVAQAYQRHLLQLACTDRLLGEFLQAARARSLRPLVIVVTADQGVSVEAGQSRRSVDPAHPTNLADLAFVPLFFKRPGQRTVQSRHACAHAGHRRDDRGRARNQNPVARGRAILLPARPLARGELPDRSRLGHANVHALARQRARTVRRKVALFGGGLLRLGPHPELLGRQVSDLHVVPATARAGMDGKVAALLRSLPANSELQPAQMMGSITGPGAAENRQLAVAVNGRIAAVTRTYRQGSTVRYSAMAPESAFHPGRNKVGLYWIAQSRGALVLGSIGP